MSEAAPADRPPVMAKQPALLRRMTGRDVDGQHRTSTPRELLMDLTFVVAFGVAASELSQRASALRDGYVQEASTELRDTAIAKASCAWPCKTT